MIDNEEILGKVTEIHYMEQQLDQKKKLLHARIVEVLEILNRMPVGKEWVIEDFKLGMGSVKNFSDPFIPWVKVIFKNETFGSYDERMFPKRYLWMDDETLKNLPESH